jgi:hypothetical protein
MRRKFQSACVALSLLFVCGCAAAAARPSAVRRQDGFTYPGQTPEAARFNERWVAYMKRTPGLPSSGDADVSGIGWMIGAWTAQPRDFPSSMTDPATAEAAPASPATIAWTPGRRWLRISFVAQPLGVEWTYYLGHDPVSRRWLLHYLATPSLVFGRPVSAASWAGDRLTFAATTADYRGFRDVQRFVIVRNGPDTFRIVTEVRMPSGTFVAMDDVLFTRANAPSVTHQRP